MSGLWVCGQCHQEQASAALHLCHVGRGSPTASRVSIVAGHTFDARPMLERQRAVVTVAMTLDQTTRMGPDAALAAAQSVADAACWQGPPAP